MKSIKKSIFRVKKVNKNVDKSENYNNTRDIKNENKKALKNQHGITIVSLAVTVVVLMMIAIPCIVNIKTVTETDKFTKLKSDITSLKESVSQVYGSETDISKIGPKYTGSVAFLSGTQGEISTNTGSSQEASEPVKNPNDNNVYYIINVTKLKRDLRSKLGITLTKLNYGSNNYGISTSITELNKEKVYIINEKSRTIYYTEAIEYESQSSGKKYKYYRLPEDYSTMTTSRINRANAPVLKKGMNPVKFEINEKDTSKMKTVATTADDENWYNYEEKRWANAKTEDGSLWVWIPRFAYRIIQPASSDTERKGTTSIVFLEGTTDNYYDENSQKHTAKRCTNINEVVDTTTGYTVHPAFTDESKINFRNGGWDSELYGIWISKFEAAYATKSDDGVIKANVTAAKYNVSSGINYSESIVWGTSTLAQKENPTQAATGDCNIEARNYVDGTYGSTATSIKYPTFQGSSYSMNYINLNDTYLLVKRLTATGNIYGLQNDTDSHLIKNSEWGAVAYLSKSQYGLSSIDIAINSRNFYNDTKNVYAGTGYNNQKQEWNDTHIQFKNSASTTGNIYGVYDMSGGTWKRTAAFVFNNSGNLARYGASIITGGKTSTKYVEAYASNETSSTNTDDLRMEANYNANSKIYGNAIKETSITGKGLSSWNLDYSEFPEGGSPFIVRGGSLWVDSAAGVCAYNRSYGTSDYFSGFRAILV